MKRYKAIVIDGKKIIRQTLGVGIGLVILLLVVVNMGIARPWSGEYRTFVPERIIRESIPVLNGSSPKGETALAIAKGIKKAVNFVLTFDPSDGRTVLFGELPLMRSISGGYLASTANEKTIPVYNPKNADKGEGKAEPDSGVKGVLPIKEVDSSQAKTLGEKSGKILIRNETDFSINIDEMLSAPLKIDMKGDSPKVLIVHTHGTECYSPEGSTTYRTDKSDRSLDKESNMVKVGKEMKEVFEEKGISVIHDTTLHDHPDFNGSYENARKTIERYLEKYPSICVVLDVHRDAFIYEDGSKAKFLTHIDGRDVAQLMLVVGTSGGGLDHPQWRENMKFALKLQNHISKEYPTLMRGVNLRNERFNGHTTYGSLIIEVGSSGNTLAEAVEGARYGALKIAEFMNGLK